MSNSRRIMIVFATCVLALAATGCKKFLRGSIQEGVSEGVADVVAELIASFVPVEGAEQDEDD